jgi:hypothetical protein
MSKPSKNLQGRRVRLIKCNDSFTKIPAGTTGVVSLVDDMGTLHVNWDNGSTLGLCWDDGDRWEVIAVQKAS